MLASHRGQLVPHFIYLIPVSRVKLVSSLIHRPHQGQHIPVQALLRSVLVLRANPELEITVVVSSEFDSDRDSRFRGIFPYDDALEWEKISSARTYRRPMHLPVRRFRRTRGGGGWAGPRRRRIPRIFRRFAATAGRSLRSRVRGRCSWAGCWSRTARRWRGWGVLSGAHGVPPGEKVLLVVVRGLVVVKVEASSFTGYCKRRIWLKMLRVAQVCNYIIAHLTWEILISLM